MEILFLVSSLIQFCFILLFAYLIFGVFMLFLLASIKLYNKYHEDIDSDMKD